MIRQISILSLAGALGTLARYFLGTFIQQQKSGWDHFPVGTLSVNLMGCFLIGFLGTLADEKAAFLSPEARLFFVTGFLGAFTTFSSFSYETWVLMKNGQTLYALGNVGLSLILCFAGLVLGILAARIAH